MQGLRLAVGTLTRWPVRPPERVDRESAGTAMLIAPALGLILGALCGLPLLSSAAERAPALAAVLVVAAVAFCTGGLHLDGLADTADAFAASSPAAAPGSRERGLAVMHRSDVGPIGASTLILVLGIQVAAITALIQLSDRGQRWFLVVAAVTASRLVLPVLCRRGIPAARGSGLGASVAGTVPPGALAATVGASAATLVGLAIATGVSWWLALLAPIAAGVVAHALTRSARRRFGGVSGDVLGAAVEIALAAALTTQVLVLASR